MKDRSIFTIAVALVSLVTLAASMSGAWLEQAEVTQLLLSAPELGVQGSVP
jgi:hypothetical protein